MDKIEKKMLNYILWCTVTCKVKHILNIRHQLQIKYTVNSYSNKIYFFYICQFIFVYKTKIY